MSYAPANLCLSEPTRIHSAHQNTITTPVRHRHTVDCALQYADSKRKRDVVYADVSPYGRVVSPEFFFDNVIPSLQPGISVDATINALKEKGIIKANIFSSIMSKKPSNMKGIENHVFKKLEPLVDAILATVAAKPTMKFLCNPDGVPTSIARNNKSRPDCYTATLDTDADDVKWVNLGVYGELKKDENSDKHLDNSLKIIGSMHHAMAEDSRRRAVIAFTIDDASMRLWYCDRQRILSSNPFHFIRRASFTVHFFLSIMFAQPHQLGWDTSMVPVLGMPGQYDITIRDGSGVSTVYRTIELISDVGAECILSRGTRVWKAVKQGDDPETGPLVAIKDFWIDDDRKSEGEIYQQLRDQGVPDKNFLKVITHGSVFIPASNQRDHTTELTPGDEQVPTWAPPLNLTQLFSKMEKVRSPAGSYLHPHVPPPMDYKMGPKLHYRMALDGVYPPLHSWTCLSDIFYALSEVCSALHEMHKVGLVHRDITPANILVQKADDGTITAKLVDLEHAKSTTSESMHCVRSGACQFTPIEVETATYIHEDRCAQKEDEVPEIPSDDYVNASRPDSDSSDGEDSDCSSEGPPKFRYNPIHDFDSLWWNALFFNISRQTFLNDVPCTVSFKQRQECWELFLCEETLTRRQIIFTNANQWKYLGRSLHPALQYVFRELTNLRKVLLSAYDAAERDWATLSGIDNTVADEVFLKFQASFSRIAKVLKEREFRMTVCPTFGLEDFQELEASKKKKLDTIPESDESTETNEPKRQRIESDLDDTLDNHPLIPAPMPVPMPVPMPAPTPANIRSTPRPAKPKKLKVTKVMNGIVDAVGVFAKHV